MPVWVRITVAFVVSAIVALVVWYVSGSTTATYIVAVLTMAAAVAALFAVNSSGKGRLIRSRIKIRRAHNSNITGVIRPAKYDGDIKSDIKVRDIGDGDVTGVRQD